MSEIPTFPFSVSVARRRKTGTILPFKVMRLARVPAVGEYVSAVAGEGDADDKPAYRVVSVVHFDLVHRAADNGAVAEVWAVEVDGGDPGFDP
jgi:hypothetical protein